MPPKYKLIMGNGQDTNKALEKEAKEGWKPILFDAIPANPPTEQVKFAIILEKSAE